MRTFYNELRGTEVFSSSDVTTEPVTTAADAMTEDTADVAADLATDVGADVAEGVTDAAIATVTSFASDASSSLFTLLLFALFC